MPRILTAQVERAVRDLIAGPASATANHLVVFDGTSGKLVKDGGASGGGGGGGLPDSTGANKVLFDNGTTQDWSDTPSLKTLDVASGLVTADRGGITIAQDYLSAGAVAVADPSDPSDTGYDYQIVPFFPDGSHLDGVQASAAAGATLDETHVIILTWDAVPGASSYKVYALRRGSESSGTLGLLATVTALTYTDHGAAGNGVQPTAADRLLQLEVGGDGTFAAYRRDGIWGKAHTADSVHSWLAFRRNGGLNIGGLSATGIYMQAFPGPHTTEIGFDFNNDDTNPLVFVGINNSDSFDWTHDGDILIGRSLNATADNQTWFGDTVNPVFLIGTPNITVISSGDNDTSFRLKNKTNAELGCIYWDDNNWVMGTQGGVDEGGTARDTILSSAANLILATEGTSRWTLDHDTGHLRPWADATYDIGTASDRVRNLYLTGLTFDNEGRILSVVRVNDVTVTPTVNGDPGTTSYTYAVVATFPDGGAHTSVYDTRVLVETGAATLDADHSITLAWDPTPGASGYNVYRVVSNGTPSSIGLIGTMGTDLSTPFVDTGLEGDGIVPPFTNTTGRLDLSGPLVTFNSGPLVLGLPGSPTADQTITPAPSTSGGGASVNINGQAAVDGNNYGGGVFLTTGLGSGSHGAGWIQLTANPLQFELNTDTPAFNFTGGPVVAPDFVVSGSRFRSDETDGHSASLSAYDTDTGTPATGQLGHTADGIVGITVNLAGLGGNAYTVTSVAGVGNDVPLSAALSGTAITVTLGTDSGGSLDPTKNTATLVAAAVDALDDVSATASGTGADPLTAAEGPNAFSGGAGTWVDFVTVTNGTEPTCAMRANSIEIPGLGFDQGVLFNDGGAIGAASKLAYSKLDAGLSLSTISCDFSSLTSTPSGGSTLYEYGISATFDSGRVTGPLSANSVPDGPAALDADNYITLTWDAVPGAVSYSIYAMLRNGTPSSVGLIGTVSAPTTTFVDNGIEGDGVVPDLPGLNGTGVISADTVIANRLLQLYGNVLAPSDTLTLGLAGAPTANQTIQPAAATGTDQDGADLAIAAGAPSGTGQQGILNLLGSTVKVTSHLTVASQTGDLYTDGSITAAAGVILPTADPHIVGALWNNANAFAISAG